MEDRTEAAGRGWSGLRANRPPGRQGVERHRILIRCTGAEVTEYSQTRSDWRHHSDGALKLSDFNRNGVRLASGHCPVSRPNRVRNPSEYAQVAVGHDSARGQDGARNRDGAARPPLSAEESDLKSASPHATDGPLAGGSVLPETSPNPRRRRFSSSKPRWV